MDVIAENYQLKWHSFSSYMHSCVAGALFNETFADVALYTVDGLCVMAHKFILSSCSQYFHQVLKLAPRMVTTLPLVVVLPPEISYKTLKILVQYMYSGESTVSKDILQQVLRGGDILKVKGLWRPKEEQEAPQKKVVKSPVNNSSQVAQQEPEKQRSDKSKINERPKVLNYPMNINQEKSNNRESSGSSDIVSTNKKKEAPPKENHLQNSVIKCTQSEKSAPSTTKRKDCEKTEIPNATTPNNETVQFLVIKEEPLEWSEMGDADMELVESKDVFSTEITIKPEIFADTDSGGSSENLYTPLTCELCSETFSVPAEWVRHVQTHTDMLPAKRQRRGRPAPDEENAPFPPLTCDMCQNMFPTPAEWVHHIQNTHTEFELHWTNIHLNKSGDGTKMQKHSKHLGPIQKVCSVCTKKFPSHASMLIHKRTHTGEKPYACEYCMKGFNVKSNLLRHLRTLHDKIIQPTDVDGLIFKEEEGKND